MYTLIILHFAFQFNTERAFFEKYSELLAFLILVKGGSLLNCERNDVVGVLLGYSAEKVRKLCVFCSEVHVFDDRYSLAAHLLLNAHFHKVSFKFSQILALHLLDLASKKPDKLFILYASDDKKHVLDELSEHVECRYIIKKTEKELLP